jgi:flavin reductase (DIM6/NTAB) family NADH-FMN oxidoreductase RutF
VEAEVSGDFRQAMRRHAGGVAILTALEKGEPRGIVATAVMSLTMTPPALAIAVNRSSSFIQSLDDGGRFCANLLHRSQAELCRQFAALPPAERFSVGEWATGRLGIPYLPDAQAAVVCSLGPVQVFGTHRLIIGLVDEVVLSAQVGPLMYVDGAYAALAPVS